MNNIKIIVDSGCDISTEYAQQNNITLVPLVITLDNIEYIDDYNLDTEMLVDKIASCSKIGGSACPSPNSYLQAFQGGENIFVITLSSKISGSYNSACLAKDIYLEENSNANIYIIDSETASSGQCFILDELIHLIETENNFRDICNKIDKVVENASTFFILDDMSTLIKNGRIKGLKALLIEKLNLKLIMTEKSGEIIQHDVVRGTKKSIQKLALTVKKFSETKLCKNLYITSCFAQDKVNQLLTYLKENGCFDNFSKIIVNNSRGISTLYANKGGIVLTF